MRRVCQHCQQQCDTVIRSCYKQARLETAKCLFLPAELKSPLLAEADILFLAGKPAHIYTGQQAEV